MAHIEIPSGYGLIAIRGQNATGHHCVSEIGVSFVGTLAQSDVNTFSTSIGPPTANTYTSPGGYAGITVTYRTAGGTLQQFISNSGAATSGRTGTNMTPQVVGLISKKTDLVGRKFRGRCYIGDVRETDADDTGTLTVATVSNLQSAADAWTAACHVTPFTGPVLLHSDPAIPPTPLVQMLASSRVATQRRRYKR